MGGSLLDTNCVIAVFAEDPAAKELVARASQTYLSTVVLGELYYGARRSSGPAENVERVDAWTAAGTVIGCDLATARRYGQVKGSLRSKGKPIPDNDVWIAAIALQHGLVLTRDTHFSFVDGLQVTSW